MNLLYLTMNAELGGAEMALLDVMATVRAVRPTWRLGLLIGEEGPLADEARRAGLEVRVLPLAGRVTRLGDAAAKGRLARLALAARMSAAAPAALGYLATLRAAIREFRPDVVHTNGMKGHALGSWSVPRGVPMIWHLQDYPGRRAVMSRVLRAAARRRPIVAAISRSVAEDAARVLGPTVPVRVRYIAVDLARFAPGPGDGPALDAAAGLPPAPPGTVRVGLVATFAVWKGHEVFLQAAARLPADAPCRFYIVGGPIYRSTGSQWTLDALKARAEALGLAGRVAFTGPREPAAAMRSLDVVVHASTEPEPYGRVIVEGMACGRAVVAAKAGGAAELFRDGVEALGVPPGDPDALAGALGRLVADESLRRRLGVDGRRRVESQFDRLALAGPWAELYEQAAAPGRAALA